MTSDTPDLHAPDGLIIRTLWPVMLAATIGLFPFTVYSTFLVPIAQTADQDVAVVGTLRGLGGIAALIVGVALAPLVARWSAARATVASLALISGACLVATLRTLPAIVVFCVGVGAATAILTPVLLRIATTTFSSRGDSGRAATIVTATQSLAAVLAAPVIGGIGLWRGWEGAFWVTAGAAVVIALLFLRRDRDGPRPMGQPLRYLEAFGQLRRRRDLLALIAIAFLRTTAFMGYLSFLAAHYQDRFGLDAVTFTLVWTLSGASFFAGNYLAGRWARGSRRHRGRLLGGGLVGAAAAVLLVFTTDLLPLVLVATAVMGFGHAVVAALVTTQIAERGGELTAAAYSINAAGMSCGVFVGALIAGVGLAQGGSPGIAVALVVPTLVAIALLPAVTARPAGGRLEPARGRDG